MIVGDRFSFVLNPKCASSSLKLAFDQMGYEPAGLRHAVFPTHKSIRGVVHRDDQARLKSGWRKWSVDGTSYSDWVNGPSLEVAAGIDFKRTPQRYWTDNATHILRFEHLAHDWSEFCVLAGLPEIQLMHLNRSHRWDS